MNVLEMEARVGEVSALLKTLANQGRLLTLCQLVDGEKSVGELAAALELSQPTMSQQLALLRRQGVVTTRREGQVVYYSLPRGPARKLLGFLQRTFCQEG